jgi:branched-chain amino acid transport system permease protein
VTTASVGRAAWPRPPARHVAIGAVFVLALALLALALGSSLFVSLTIAGLGTGGIYALSGMGLVLTYKVTGVFNFAHGAIAMLVAYLLWQLHVQWGVTLWIAAPLVLLVIGPGIGMLLERVVFRPLDQREASAAERLVATLGVFVLFVGVATAIWTSETRTDPARLFPDGTVTIGSYPVGIDRLSIVLIVVVVSVLLYALQRFTSVGTLVRAVVDRKELAQLAGIRANRVVAFGWAMGAGFAGFTGVLLAPTTFGLDPFRLTLLVVETFAVALVARLVSLPVAALAGLALGMLNAYLTQFSFGLLVGWIGGEAAADRLAEVLDPVIPNFLVLVLFAALLFSRQLRELGASSAAASFVARATIRAQATTTQRLQVLVPTGVLVLLLPLVLDRAGMRQAQLMFGLALILLSIVAITGLSGHLTLGMAGFAGFGAFLMGRFHAGTVPVLGEMPVSVAMVLAAACSIPLSLLVAYPALRRSGLFLGLTTLAFGLLLERTVFTNFQAVAGQLSIARPAWVDGELAFYYYCAGLLVVGMALTHNLRRGRLGRVMGAMRDSEAGLQAVGISLRNYKLFIFAFGAVLASVGGMILAQAARSFSAESFMSVEAIIWFAAVMVMGVSTITGALLAAAALTVLDVLLGDAGVTVFLVGLLALFLGRMPGGVVGLVLERWHRVRARPPQPAADAAAYRPSPLASRVFIDLRPERPAGTSSNGVGARSSDAAASSDGTGETHAPEVRERIAAGGGAR